MIIGLNSIVPSKDVKAYIKENNIEFTLEEEATLVYLSRLDYDVKIAFLKKIAENCSNEDSKLKEEINARVAKMLAIKNKFFSQEENVIYTVALHYNYYNSWDKESLVFSKIDDAKKYLKEEVQDDNFLEESPNILRITKTYIDTNPEEYMYATYDVDFNLKDIDTVSIKDFEEDATDFTCSFVEVLHPFRRGDLVKDINTDKVYIVTYPKNDNEYFKDVEKNKKFKEENKIDAFDIGLYVEELDENRFIEAHILPTQAEFVDLDTIESFDETKKNYLNSISRLLKGEESLEMFSEMQRDYLKIF